MDLKELLKIIVAKGASDLHLDAGLPPMMRLNGALQQIDEAVLQSQDIEAMVSKIIPDGKKALVLEGEIDVAAEIKNVARFRVNLYHDRNGLCAAFRFVPNVIKSVNDLGLPDVVNNVARMRRGLVLVAGVAGSGKSTTLASIIDAINSERHDHIITIEDPIEFVHKHKNCIVNQREIGTHARSCAEALRAALREDPDVILVGEMRDLETISMAMTAAETGHLVLGTLHTRGAAQTIDRIVDIFPPQQQEQIRIQLAESLEMVISQVLLPCTDGRHSCVACEVMVTTPGIRQLIRSQKIYQIATEIEIGGQVGMVTLEKSLKSLVNAGKISLQTAVPWVRDPKVLQEP